MKPFQNCWDRIERAEAHHLAFAKLWNDLSAKDSYKTWSHVLDDGTGEIWIAIQGAKLPSEHSLIFGEMLYQLRAALDGAVYAAAIVDSRKDNPPKEHLLEFPICDSWKDFDKQTRKIAPLSAQRKALIEAVQPFNTPEIESQWMIGNYNRSLSILNDWARKDRHRKLHIAGSWAFKATPQFRLPPATEISYLNVIDRVFLAKERKIADFKISGWTHGMCLQTNPDCYIDIAIEEGPPACHLNDTFTSRVASIIETVGVVVSGIENGIWPIVK